MQGLRAESPERFAALFAPVLRDLDRLYWLIDFPGGPFNIVGEPNFEELDVLSDGFVVNVPCLANTSAALWKPGVLNAFGALLYEDDGSYMTGFFGPQEHAVQRVTSADWRGLDQTWLQAGHPAVIAKPRINCWEIYSTQAAWLDRLEANRLWERIDSASEGWLQ